MNTRNNRVLTITAGAIAVGLIGLGIYQAVQQDIFREMVSFIDEDMSSELFIISMIILPVVGFPVSVVLIMAGIKFGIWYALLLWLLILPIHAFIGYYLARLLRKPLKIVSSKMGYPMPELPEKGKAMFSFLFLAIPGIPYAGKNYLLALAGAPFTYCVLMNAAIQFPQGVPFVILGRSAMELDMSLFYLALVIILIIYIILRWLKNKYGDKIGIH